MLPFIVQRLLQFIPVVFVVTIFVFLLSYLGGDPVYSLIPEGATPERVEELRHELGLDLPLYEQYWNWISRALSGDLGLTLTHRRSVAELIAQRLPVTVLVGVLGLLLSVLIGLPVGLLAAVKRGTGIDMALMWVANALLSMPNFMVALGLILLFALTLRWVPPSGYVPLTTDLFQGVQSMLLPALSVGAHLAAVIARMTRASVIEALDREFVTTARAKGLTETTIVVGHVLRNALIPVVTIFGLQIAAVLGGSPIIETVFALPGLGALLVIAIQERDMTVMQAAILVSVLFVGLAGLAADLAYAYLNPRIRIK